jgi:uncharacterized membrane protein YcaP (DUF421 family)
MHALLELAGRALGLDLEEGGLGLGQMALRGVLVFAAGLVLVRAANRRFVGRSTAFDVVLGFIFGSMLSRAITGNAPLWPVLGPAAVLVALHWLLAAASFRWHRLSVLVKGNATLLVEDGRMDRQEMRRTHTTLHDLEEALRQSRGLSDVATVRLAYLERSGEISVVPARGEGEGPERHRIGKDR